MIDVSMNYSRIKINTLLLLPMFNLGRRFQNLMFQYNSINAFNLAFVSSSSINKSSKSSDFAL